jgi:predicted DNA-binding transcriptional regulator YafY
MCHISILTLSNGSKILTEWKWKNLFVEPYGLIWNQDYYYLIAGYGENNEIRHYRVDRMRDVIREETNFIPNPTFNLQARIRKKLFHVYSGEERPIEIEYHKQLINVVIDRFGVSANIKPNVRVYRTERQSVSSGLFLITIMLLTRIL